MILSELALYPVKSCAQVRVGTLRIDRFGPHRDRRWMLVDGNNRFLTQRKLGRMCLIRPELTNDGIVLHAPDMPALGVTRPGTGTRRLVRVWEDHCDALDAGDAAADWLSRFLSTECRLVYFPEEGIRAVDPAYARSDDLTAFSDGFPFLLIGQASLDDLNRRLETPLPMARFRPNLVVAGGEPYAEDGWRRIRIGAMTFRVVKPCNRCVIPTIDLATGERGVEPTRTLATYRKRDNRIYFGQNVIADGEGELQAGMPVEVLE
ncbi:MAG TPA: MOSC domain-containing protein [Chromatiales bacterium]|nr:MOSC domain-containing protein [Chromatiales bacterium]